MNNDLVSSLESKFNNKLPSIVLVSILLINLIGSFPSMSDAFKKKVSPELKNTNKSQQPSPQLKRNSVEKGLNPNSEKKKITKTSNLKANSEKKNSQKSTKSAKRGNTINSSKENKFQKTYLVKSTKVAGKSSKPISRQKNDFTILSKARNLFMGEKPVNHKQKSETISKNNLKKSESISPQIIINPATEISSAQEPLLINVPSIIDFIERQNLDLAIARSQVKQSQGNYIGSYADVLPSIRGQASVESFRGGEIFFNNLPITFNRVTYRPLASADYQIQTGGRGIYQIKAAGSQLNRIKFSQDRVFQSALLNALTSYYLWLRDRAALGVAKQAYNEVTEQLKLSQERFANGFATKLEVMQNESLQANRESELLEAVNKEKLSAIILSTILNIPLTRKIYPDPNDQIIPIEFIASDLNLDKLFEIALSERPDIKEVAALVNELRNRYGIARSDLFPSINLSGYYRGIGPIDSLQSSLQGFVSLNLDVLRSMGVGIAGNMVTAKARVTEAVATKQKEINQVDREVSQAYFDMHVQKRKIEAAKKAIKSSQEAYEIAKMRLKQGLGINLEVIHAQTEAFEAKLNYQTSVTNYNNAQIALLHHIGQLIPSKVVPPTLKSSAILANANQQQTQIDDEQQVSSAFKPEKLANDKQQPSMISAKSNLVASNSSIQNTSEIKIEELKKQIPIINSNDNEAEDEASQIIKSLYECLN